MQKSAIYKMKDEKVAPNAAARGKQREPISVCVRAGRSASPLIDISALKNTAESLKKTLEELDGACG